MKIFPIMTLTAAVALAAIAAHGQAAQVVVDQRSDLSAPSAEKMYSFVPEIVRIAPGETVAFLNSRGSHTVHSQEGMWPEGAPVVAISGRSEAIVQFDTPGLYGLTCRRHGRYGMVMVVAVGAVDPAAVDLGAVPASDRAKAAYRRIFDRLDPEGAD